MCCVGDGRDMSHDQATTRSQLQYVHEGMFALNLGLTGMALIFLYSAGVTKLLFRMDASINRSLHIPQSDLVWGYWALFLPGTALAICIWSYLRLFSRSAFTQGILRTLGGMAAITYIPIYWLLARYAGSHRYGWTPLRSLEFYEAVAVLLVLSAAFYLERIWSFPLWLGITGIVLHYGFWFWQFGTYHVFSGNSIPISFLPIVGLLASIAWLLYARATPRAFDNSN
jgi:hypothetical protein